MSGMPGRGRHRGGGVRVDGASGQAWGDEEDERLGRSARRTRAPSRGGGACRGLGPDLE